MQGRFRLDEMVHQDEMGVVFRGWDVQRAQPVALRRFFLPESLLAKLAEVSDGRSLYSRGIETLQGLVAPKLRRVIGGGLDEVDGIPYIVTEWWPGRSLREELEVAELGEGEQRRFLEQAESLLSALPEEVRELVSWREEEIVVERTGRGEVLYSFRICPRKFFSQLAGRPLAGRSCDPAVASLCQRLAVAEEAMVRPEAPREEESSLVDEGSKVLPQPAEVPRTGRAEERPVLKSAQQGTGKGLIGVLIPVLLLSLGGLFFFLSDRVGRVQGEASADLQEREVVMDEKVEAGSDLQVEEAERELLPVEEADSPLAHSSEKQVGGFGGREVPTAQRIVSQKDAVAEPVRQEPQEPVVAEASTPVSKISNQVMVEPEPEPEPEGVELIRSNFVTAGSYSPRDVAALRELNGQDVQVRGVVQNVDKSSGKGAWWYLEFGDYKEEAYGVFKVNRATEGADWTVWEKFVGKEVLASGKVQLGSGFATRGSNVRIILAEMSSVATIEALEAQKLATVFSVADVTEFREYIEADVAVKVKGTLARFEKTKGWRYLVFSEGIEVCARFAEESELSKDRAFLARLAKMKGRMVQVKGRLVAADLPRIVSVVELVDADQVTIYEE